MKLKQFFGIVALFICSSLTAIDNPHFWRATNFLPEFYEPRLAWPWLTSGYVTLGFGGTHSAEDSHGITVPLEKFFDPLIVDPDSIHFKIAEANLSLSQNLTRGFFVQAHIPIRKLAFNNQTTNQNHHHRGFGDLSVLGGWTINYENTQDLDYIDATIRFGGLFPTGSNRDLEFLVDVSNGYGGHYALPISLALAVGWYDWITAGTFFGVMPFFKKKETFDQLLSKPGTLWEVNAYLKADHMLLGFSFLINYSFAHQKRSSMNALLIQPEFLRWTMHTLNFLASYDFATYQKPYLPEVGFYYNLIVGGKNIFNTDMGGLSLGVNIACRY